MRYVLLTLTIVLMSRYSYGAELLTGKDDKPGIVTAIKNGIYSPTSGIGVGIAGSIVHIIARIFHGSWSLIAAVLQYCTYMTQRGFNKACRRPDPLDGVTVQCWYDLIEQITHDICDAAPSGALMLRALRVEDDTTRGIDHNWRTYTAMVERMCHHIILRIERVLPYYQGGDQQRSWLVALSRGMVALDRDTITFLLHEVVHNLTTLMTVLAQSSCRDDVCVEQLRPVCNTTLLLLKKIHTLVCPVVQQDFITKASSFGIGNTAARFDTIFS